MPDPEPAPPGPGWLLSGRVTTLPPLPRVPHLKLSISVPFLSLVSPLATTQGTTNLSNFPWKDLVREACANWYS